MEETVQDATSEVDLEVTDRFDTSRRALLGSWSPQQCHPSTPVCFGSTRCSLFLFSAHLPLPSSPPPPSPPAPPFHSPSCPPGRHRHNGQGWEVGNRSLPNHGSVIPVTFLDGWLVGLVGWLVLFVLVGICFALCLVLFQSSGCPVRRQASQGQCWDWSGRGQSAVTRRHSKFHPHLLSQHSIQL